MNCELRIVLTGGCALNGEWGDRYQVLGVESQMNVNTFVENMRGNLSL